ncbi:MAG: chromosome segregation protein SMC [Oscillospiraceae bacterium]|nr:chromosome segregation protein SMC [Oscillospiraceae bacterium]
MKSFEIQGFKSFPDKTVMPFDHGVCAVVGPNGSGKSNIAEAVRWVLGEQNPRALRCEKRMEELIFHGAAHRGPTGFAEVSLMLDNSGGLFPLEQNEVSITRRLYRSGESEYYINRVAVRLRDVLDLFMDTGLGRDGYCLIGQGRISEILSEKSGDRRRVFEEASGISRFRHRKEESERKLASSEENLTRIGDKIEELELQIGPLREQADTARRYLRLRDELRGLEINLWLDALHKLRVSYEKVRDNHWAVSEQLGESLAKVEKTYAEAERLQGEERDTVLKSEGTRGALSSFEAEIAELDSAIAVLRANASHNEENRKRLLLEQEAGQDRDGGLRSQIESRRADIADLGARQAALESEGKALLAQVDEISHRGSDASDKLNAMRIREVSLRETVSSLRVSLSSQTAAAAEWEARLSIQGADLEVRAAGLAEAVRQLAKLDGEIADGTVSLEELRNAIDGHTMRRDSRQRKVEKLREKCTALSADAQVLESRVKMLREMEREYEGHSRAVRSVMRESGRGALRGIRGTLSSLLRADDRCAVAVETALGASLQSIVVEREEDAKAAIGLLRRQDAGRATFLPLTAIRGLSLEERGLENEPGFVGLADTLVSFSPEYGDIVRNLLGRTVVTESLDDAVGLARRRGHRFRIVTLDGQVIARGGAMTGGSASKSVGALSRKNELERLETKLSDKTAQAGALARERENAERELSAAQYDLDVAQSERRVAEDEALSLRSERTHKGVWYDGLREAHKALQAERDDLVARLADSATTQREQQADIERRAAEAGDLAEQIAALSEGQADLYTESTRLAETIAELRAQGAALGAEKNAAEKSVADLEELRAQLVGDLDKRNLAIASYEQKIKGIAGEIHAKTENQAEKSARAAELRTQLLALSERQGDLEGRRVAADRAAREFNEENLRLERECARLEGQKASGEAEEKAIMEKLWDNYGLTHSAALEQRTQMDSVHKANRRAGELKAAIKALGSPNIGAIDEYDRISGRYEYLTTQRDDAALARSELLQIIDDLTGRMKEIFLEQFALIGEKFGQTFREIFSGGDARLELEDPEDPLHCGVEIRAQPPGKKMRSITLLSGGEKSLVAIALYFAIFKVRPAPFCVLDEVDHDLDDINVARFAAYLRRLSEDIQFVVVTHRRGAMEAADMLYGVTTQEEGVSKIISLKLQDAEKSLGMTLE